VRFGPEILKIGAPFICEGFLYTTVDILHPSGDTMQFILCLDDPGVDDPAEPFPYMTDSQAARGVTLLCWERKSKTHRWTFEVRLTEFPGAPHVRHYGPREITQNGLTYRLVNPLDEEGA